MITLEEPFPPWAWPVVWSWIEPFKSKLFDDYGPRTAREFVDFTERTYTRTFGIFEGGRLGGAVAFQQPWESLAIAHMIFAPRMYRVATAEGLYEACQRLFATSKTVKILGLIPEDNRLAIALALRHGARLEGTLRAHTLRNGKPLNVVAVGVTREEFDGLQFRRRERRHIGYAKNVGLDNLHGECQRDGIEHVLPLADSVAEPARDDVIELIERGLFGNSITGRAGAEDGGGRHDQQELHQPGRPDEPGAGGPRVRTKRNDRINGPENRTGKTRRPGRKRV
jgi:hypothetical protein